MRGKLFMMVGVDLKGVSTADYLQQAPPWIWIIYIIFFQVAERDV
jgi:hypothetical protein